MKNMIIASTSTVYGSGYLEYLLPELKIFFKDTSTILFVPYARPSGLSHDAYTAKAKNAFSKININVVGIHEFENPKQAIDSAEGIFVGGGNTFVLVNELYKQDLLNTISTAVNNGLPYLGTSAGSNICGLTMQTTNDMPIVYPPSFTTLGLIPFNLNPHYLDPDLTSTHKGETRATRIKEFHAFNNIPVLGLREGSWLLVKNNSIILKGNFSARCFTSDGKPKELTSLTDISSL